MVDVETESKAAAQRRGTWGDGDESGRGSDGIFAGVLASYDERGYERGYRRAVSDGLSLLLLATEEYLRAHQDQLGLAGVIYPFEEHLERELRRLGSRDSGFVTGGLGI